MRELKFRMWDKVNNKFISPFRFEHDDYYKTTGMVLLDFHGKIRIAEYSSGNGDNSASSVYSEIDNADNYVVQQYTGLTDINNNPIYQGDIVKYIPSDFASGSNIRVGTIIFCNYFNGWAVKDATNYSVYNLNVPFMGLNRIEVIGNIFENPELLK
jgi:uncharacterized phage protein (TIGR01671 family)